MWVTPAFARCREGWMRGSRRGTRSSSAARAPLPCAPPNDRCRALRKSHVERQLLLLERALNGGTLEQAARVGRPCRIGRHVELHRPPPAMEDEEIGIDDAVALRQRPAAAIAEQRFDVRVLLADVVHAPGPHGGEQAFLVDESLRPPDLPI